MLGYEEKLERIKLIDAASDAGRLARGLDQLLESLAHADQLDLLDVEGVLALRSISESRQSSMRSMSSEKRSMSPKAFDRLVPPLNTMDSAKPLLWKRWSKV